MSFGLFVRLIGLCYLVTFLSEAPQMLGLVGSHGILPIADFIAAGADLSAPYRYIRLPTLFWIDASDGTIAAVPWIGALAAALVITGIASRGCLLLCYALHLSTVIAGGDFFFYPWDFLLLEATILACFVPSLQCLPSLSARGRGRPPLLVEWAVYFLLFRLQFGMGVHKFFDANNVHWRQLSYVYLWQEWQPMATSAAWYAFHYAPRWLQAGMDVYTFLVEVPVPWLLLTSGWPRLLAALLIGAMHIGIAVLGNFGTFQLVSVVLCVACISDQQWRVAIAWLRRRPQVARAGVRCEPAAHAARGWRRYVRRLDCALASGVAATAMLCGLLYTVRMMQPQGTTLLSNTRWLFVPEAELSMGYFGSQLMRATAPFFLSYPYGIFRDKPDVKLGMVFQGSSDGEHWNIYPNKLNAVEPIDRPPPFFAPYQPRLDHMFLYEAGDFHFAFVNGINPYYGAIAPLPFLTQRLFERSGDVLALFANDPLRGKTPTLLRARRARYRFTTPNERARSGDWWVRDMESILGPVDMATTLKMTETLRANARRALKHALEVDERLRPSGPAPALAYNSDAWMPPWRFWLCVLPGVLPAAWRGWRRWRLRTVAALPRQLASTSGQPGDAAGP